MLESSDKNVEEGVREKSR